MATWQFTIPSAGNYEVFARWTSKNNHASNAPYTINHHGVATLVTVDQKVNGGQDNSLGTFFFDAGVTTITLSDDANGFVIADAVHVSPVGATPNRATWNPMLTQAAEYEVFAKDKLEDSPIAVRTLNPLTGGS